MRNLSAAAAFTCATEWKDRQMLKWALIFFVVAIIAAVFGFGGIASASAGIAQILFFVFIVLFLVALVGNFMRKS